VLPWYCDLLVFLLLLLLLLLQQRIAVTRGSCRDSFPSFGACIAVSRECVRCRGLHSLKHPDHYVAARSSTCDILGFGELAVAYLQLFRSARCFYFFLRVPRFRAGEGRLISSAFRSQSSPFRIPVHFFCACRASQEQGCLLYSVSSSPDL
jgi:hypothetical protein